MKPRVLVCALMIGLLVAPAASGQGRTFRGLSLEEALQALQASGLPVVFSSSVVRDSMRVESEPRGTTPRARLDELLRPHGLRVEEVAGRLVVVAAEPPRAPQAPASAQPPDTEPAPMQRVKEEIVVTPGASDTRQDGPLGTLTLDLAEVAKQPHLGNDTFRSLSVLPGTAVSEASSQVSVRGGRDDEVLVLLDGLELLSPYHIQELGSALSIVAPTFLGRVSLSTGGYSAEYGDRMSGVIDMTTLTPAHGTRFGLGIGLVFAEASAAGTFAGERGRWYSAFRDGDYHLALEVSEREEEPGYWDSFGKLEYSLRPGQNLQLNALFAEDELDLPASESEEESYRSQWGNRYLWLTHDAVLGSDLLAESIVSAGRLDRDRAGSAEGSFLVRDSRVLDLAGLKNVWRWAPWERASFEAGAELRQLRSTVDYFNDRELTDPLAPLRPEPPADTTRFQGVLSVDQTNAFVSSRLRPLDALTAEVGIRFDHHSALDESRFSPRFNLAWQPRDDSIVRLAWGWFHQSQRPNELQVEDGETVLARSERAEHHILGFEHRRDGGGIIRVEAYQRLLRRPRARFENLFDPTVLFPELTGDRIRIAPEAGRAQGIELFLSGARGANRGPLGWSLSYALSSIEDELDGRWVPRSNDQPHSVRADLDYRMARGWNLHAAWLYHTGWPTTRIRGRVVRGPDGSARVEPVLGWFHAERLPAYHRLDARLSRTWTLPFGQLNTYLEVQNLYDRANVRGFDDFSFGLGADGEPRVDYDTLSWGEFLPSFGIRWQF